MEKRKKTALGSEEALSFEDALAQLEKVIQGLEKNDLTLDTGLELFENGITYIRTCDSHLKRVQGRVTELLRSENGDLVEKVLGSSLDAFVTKEE